MSLSLTSRTPRLDRRFFGPLGVPVLEPFLPAPSLWRGAGRKTAGLLGHVLNPAPKRRLLEAIRTSDFVVATGGGPFYSNRRAVPGLTFFQNVFHVRLAQTMGKPVIFFPQSFGPFYSSAARRAVLRLLAHSRTAGILVREAFSMERLLPLLPDRARSNVELCPDMALWLETPRPEAEDPELAPLPKPRLVLTVRDWDFPGTRGSGGREEKRRRYLRSVGRAARVFTARSGGSVVVVPHTRGPGDFEDDRILSGRLWASLEKSLPRERIRLVDLPDHTPPTRFLSLYASADIVLATRTHSAIFALLGGTAAVSIHYQPKGSGIMSMLGLGEYSFPIAGLNTDALVGAMETALERGSEIGPQLAERIAFLRSEIESKIRSILEGVA